MFGRSISYRSELVLLTRGLTGTTGGTPCLVFLGKVFTVAVFNKVFVVVMAALGILRMLDGTPIPLCATGNFTGVGKNTVGVITVNTIEFLEPVEVPEFAAVEPNVAGPTNQRNFVGRKTDSLIDTDTDINDYHRDNQAINGRCGQMNQKKMPGVPAHPGKQTHN